MPRARNIKPAFFTDDRLADASPTARLLFIGLWTLADFRGNLEYRPRQIKVHLFPYDYELDISILVQELEQSGHVRRYTGNDRDYLNIRKFTTHQNPHKKERDSGSDIPEYSVMVAQPIEKVTDPELPGKSGTDPADSCFLIPDTCFLIPDNSIPKSEKKLRVKKASPYSEDFERIWMKRPPRAGSDSKKNAYKAFNARLKEGISVDTLEDGLDRYSRFILATGKQETDFVMMTATFFGPAEHYLNPYTVTEKAINGNLTAAQRRDATARRVYESIDEEDVPF